MATHLYRLERQNIIIYWFRSNLCKKNVVIDDLISIIIRYANDLEILSFSTKFKSPNGLELYDDNKCVHRNNVEWSNSTYGERFIFCNATPVYNGTHCWRIKVNLNIYIILSQNY